MENILDDPISINGFSADVKLVDLRVSSTWFVDYVNHIVGKLILPHFTY
jgi:hypothetical protein